MIIWPEETFFLHLKLSTFTFLVRDAALPVPNVFPVCAIMHAQAHQRGEAEYLSESFMARLDESELPCSVPSASENEKVLTCSNMTDLFPADTELCLDVTREMLITAQKNDPSLAHCLYSATTTGGSQQPVAFFS